MHVLIVDDNRDSLELMALQLGALDCEVRAAGSVREAVALLDVEVPDLVLTDLCMPGEDGLALARYCRTRYPDLPVAIISGYGDHAIVRAALACGVIDWLEKPFEPSAFERLLRRVRARHAPIGDRLASSAECYGARLTQFVSALGAMSAALKLRG
jgi:DNA-binding NtrC family response regulator